MDLHITQRLHVISIGIPIYLVTTRRLRVTDKIIFNYITPVAVAKNAK